MLFPNMDESKRKRIYYLSCAIISLGYFLMIYLLPIPVWGLILGVLTIVSGGYMFFYGYLDISLNSFLKKNTPILIFILIIGALFFSDSTSSSTSSGYIFFQNTSVELGDDLSNSKVVFMPFESPQCFYARRNESIRSMQSVSYNISLETTLPIKAVEILTYVDDDIIVKYGIIEDNNSKILIDEDDHVFVAGEYHDDIKLKKKMVNGINRTFYCVNFTMTLRLPTHIDFDADIIHFSFIMSRLDNDYITEFYSIIEINTDETINEGIAQEWGLTTTYGTSFDGIVMSALGSMVIGALLIIMVYFFMFFASFVTQTPKILSRYAFILQLFCVIFLLYYIIQTPSMNEDLLRETIHWLSDIPNWIIGYSMKKLLYYLVLVLVYLSMIGFWYLTYGMTLKLLTSTSELLSLLLSDEGKAMLSQYV